MRYFIIIGYLFFCVGVFNAQNLVPNPSFETYSSCPTGISQLALAIGWNTPSDGTADYFNSCGGYIGTRQARTGAGYAGIISEMRNGSNISDYREYLQIQLTSPLIAGTEYEVEFYWSLSSAAQKYIEELGVFFSNTSTSSTNSTTLNFSPQVFISGSPLDETTNWVLFLKSL